MLMKNVDNIILLDNIEDYNIKKLIKIDKIWKKSNGKGVKIALIDSGVDVNHKELKGKVKSTFNMIDKNYDVTDFSGHGTHIAGLLVGKNVGVAPMAELHVIKVLDENGNGNAGNVLEGITHAINLGVDILCISLGIENDMPLIIKQRIVQAYEAGIIIVCSVGNDSASFARYPSAMNEVLAVGGIDRSGKLSKFSNKGYDVLAPSVEILSSYKDGNYAKMTGTSMASPLVAGLIALLISYHRNIGEEIGLEKIKHIFKNKTLNYID